jgi:hypothetical protein
MFDEQTVSERITGAKRALDWSLLALILTGGLENEHVV